MKIKKTDLKSEPQPQLRTSQYALQPDLVHEVHDHDEDFLFLYNRSFVDSSRQSTQWTRSKRQFLKAVCVCVAVLSLSTFGLIFTYNYAHYKGRTADSSKEKMGRLPISAPVCDTVSDNRKFDCNPDAPINEAVCVSRGCCWRQEAGNYSPLQGLPPLDVPFCYYPSDYVGYSVGSIREESRRTVVTLLRQRPSGFPKDVAQVAVELSTLDEKRLRVKFYDARDSTRYQVPVPVLNLNPVRNISSLHYQVTISMDGLLEISRRSSGTALFSTDLRQLVFSDQFIQITTAVPVNFIYGLGEHKDAFRKEMNWRRYTMFNADRQPTENMSLYGGHPFYLAVDDEAKGNSHGVLLFNSNAMDVLLQPTPAITWRTVGGILDFYIYLGPTSADVVRQHVALIGKPQLPPYWGLGFHLCRFGYKTVNDTMTTWKRTRDAGIPFDVQWNDIDYMDRRNDFTVDAVNYKGLSEFVNQLHEIGMHYVLIIDPGISASEKPGTYPPYDDGIKYDIFVKNSTGQLFVGKVWNRGTTVFPDFSNPTAIAYWAKQFDRLHREVPFDGAWIDMNEPSNFYDGQIDGCPNSALEVPPYLPGGLPLRTRTLCMTSQQKAGSHYDVHNLYGLYETIATYDALIAVRNKRPFIISRSTTIGQGHYGSHWTGDLASSWDHMKWTIASILEFNMYGIPLVGADICGFNGNTTVELCTRWSALGAFYPFSRNHNSDDCIDQDPVALGPQVVAAAKYALELRYSLLPYLYTLFYRASVFGETVARPLFFEFPTDKTSYEIDTQFLWGSAVMIIPVLEPKTTQVNGYFPPGKWYDYVSSRLLIDSKGENLTLDMPMDKIGVVIRGGSILASQAPKATTTETREGNFTLNVALDVKSSAKGELYFDDGDSLYTLLLARYSYIRFTATNNTILSYPMETGYEGSLVLDNVKVMGVQSKPNAVLVNGNPTEHFDFDSGLLSIRQISSSMNSPISIELK